MENGCKCCQNGRERAGRRHYHHPALSAILNQEPQRRVRLAAASLWPTNLPWNWVSWYKWVRGIGRQILSEHFSAIWVPLADLQREDLEACCICAWWIEGRPSAELKDLPQQLCSTWRHLCCLFLHRFSIPITSIKTVVTFLPGFPLYLLHEVLPPALPLPSLFSTPQWEWSFYKLELKVHQWTLHPVSFKRRSNFLNAVIQLLLPPQGSPSSIQPTSCSCLLPKPAVSQMGHAFPQAWNTLLPPIFWLTSTSFLKKKHFLIHTC